MKTKKRTKQPRHLDIYDKLRQVHQEINDISLRKLSSVQENAILSVSGVLYLAEGVFCKEDAKT